MELVRPLAAILLVFGLLAGALWALRRRGMVLPGARPRSGAGRMAVLERVALTPQHGLYLVRVADSALLVGVHAGGCTLLEKLPLASVEPRP